MKKIILILCVFGVLFFAFRLSQSSPLKKFNIAILTPTTHPSLEQIERGFIDLIIKEYPNEYSFKTFNALGNKTLMRTEVEEIGRGNYDLVFAIGAGAAQMSKEVFEKKQIMIPIVFSAVPKPLNLNLIADEKSSQNALTGVKEVTDFQRELSILSKLKPKVNTLTLMYDPTLHGLLEDRKEIEEIVAKMGITLVSVEVFKSNEILAKSSPFIEKTDVVLVIKDNTVVSGVDALVKLCDRHHKLLMASELDSVDKGAALVFGVSETIYGSEAAKKALLILENGVLPRDIPITSPPPEEFYFRADKARLQALGIEFLSKEDIRD